MSTTLTHEMQLISTTESLAVSVDVARSAQFFEAPATGATSSQAFTADSFAAGSFTVNVASNPNSAITGASVWYKRHLIATRRHGGPS